MVLLVFSFRGKTLHFAQQTKTATAALVRPISQHTHNRLCNAVETLFIIFSDSVFKQLFYHTHHLTTHRSM